MTLEELARRVFQAETRVMSANGSDIRNAEVVLSPEDWIDVVVEARPATRYPDVNYDMETGRHTFRGHPMRMDERLARGDVRLRTEVHA